MMSVYFNAEIMVDYAQAGVNISEGDKASRSAYEAAKATFSCREGMIGKPVVLEEGFTGLMDFGDFYVVQNNDGVGTKTEIARMTGIYDTLGYDLVAMVADDGICSGAEIVSITNTIDVDRVNSDEIEPLMAGLKKACIEQKIVVPGGEIGEMNTLLNGISWNATAVGVMEKDKFIDGSQVSSGDTVIALASRGFRSNGFTLVRYILKEQFGENWHTEAFDESRNWGEVTLTPCIIYHDAVLSVLGRYGSARNIAIHGLVHVTGGGIGNNLNRIVKKRGLGAELNSLLDPHPAMIQLQKMGDVADKEAYRTWNMGMGMLLIVAPEDEEKTLSAMQAQGLTAATIGSITDTPGVRIISKGFHDAGSEIVYE